LTVARKGRLPSLKDRFDNLVGNPAVKPEFGTSLELGVIYKPWSWISLDVTTFYRRVEGLIRQGTIEAMNGMPARPGTVNSGDVDIYGGEARLEGSPVRAFSAHISY